MYFLDGWKNKNYLYYLAKSNENHEIGEREKRKEEGRGG
jgi:hypothetical protein